MRPLFLLLLLAVFAPAAPVPKGVKLKGDAGRIIGTWKPDGTGTCWFRFDADGTMTTWVKGREDEGWTYTYTLDAEPAPKRMMWTVKGETKPYYHAVYELDGDGLKFNYTGVSQPLPAKVDPKGVYHSDLVRITPAK